MAKLWLIADPFSGLVHARPLTSTNHPPCMPNGEGLPLGHSAFLINAEEAKVMLPVLSDRT